MKEERLSSLALLNIEILLTKLSIFLLHCQVSVIGMGHLQKTTSDAFSFCNLDILLLCRSPDMVLLWCRRILRTTSVVYMFQAHSETRHYANAWTFQTLREITNSLSRFMKCLKSLGISRNDWNFDVQIMLSAWTGLDNSATWPNLSSSAPSLLKERLKSRFSFSTYFFFLVPLPYCKVTTGRSSLLVSSKS